VDLFVVIIVCTLFCLSAHFHFCTHSFTFFWNAATLRLTCDRLRSECTDLSAQLASSIRSGGGGGGDNDSYNEDEVNTSSNSTSSRRGNSRSNSRRRSLSIIEPRKSIMVSNSSRSQKSKQPPEPPPVAAPPPGGKPLPPSGDYNSSGTNSNNSDSTNNLSGVPYAAFYHNTNMSRVDEENRALTRKLNDTQIKYKSAVTELSDVKLKLQRSETKFQALQRGVGRKTSIDDM
jgi:hypothetical protein